MTKARTRIFGAILAVAFGLGAAWEALPQHLIQPSEPRRAPAYSDDDAVRIARLGTVVRLKPNGAVRGVVILLTDRSGWTGAMQSDAVSLQSKGVAVLGVSTPRLIHALALSKDTCASPNYSLSLLAKDYEHRLALPAYLPPVVSGVGMGGNVALAGLLQSRGVFRAGAAFGFTGQLPPSRTWCHAGRPIAVKTSDPHSGWRILPRQTAAAPWVVGAATPYGRTTAQTLVGIRARGRIMQDGAGFSASAVLSLLNAPIRRLEPRLAASIADLPLSTLIHPGPPASPFMAIVYSGDGGWVGFDHDIGDALARRGIPVVGVDSLSYFWSARTPASAAADLARVIDYYLHYWGKKRVILVGYSFGADNLPFIANALPARLHPTIARISLLGLSDSTDFQFHLGSWLDLTSVNGMPTVPAILRIRDMPVQCVRGSTEGDSACRLIPRGHALQTMLPGSHHFNRDFPRISQALLYGLRT